MAEQRMLGYWLEERITSYPKPNEQISKESAVPTEILNHISNDETITLPLSALVSLVQALGIDPSQILIPIKTSVGVQKLSFSGLLKYLRTSNIMTQQDVADKVGIPVGTYVQYETGRRQPPFPTVSKLAKVFGVALERFEDCDYEQDEDADKIWRAKIESDDDYGDYGNPPQSSGGEPIPF